MSQEKAQSGKWPDSPYKGLSYYEAEDQPLFTGRDAENEQVALLLGEGETRIMMLHGDTGCGKSSFLRAGLIPYLKDFSYEFLHRDGSADRPLRDPVFIVSSSNPLEKLALAIYQHATDEQKAKTSEHVRDMSEKQFVKTVGNDPEMMMQVLRHIASRTSDTLVLIIDQAEEVVTLSPEDSPSADRENFFQFLYLFSGRQINVKLLLSLRTEYVGRFISGIHPYTFNMKGFRDYYLQSLNDNALCEAIKWPTSTGDIPGYGNPRAKYRFSYEPGLAEHIAEELIKNNTIGSRLAVMQLICKRLYDAALKKAKKKAEWQIKREDYDELDGISNQLNSYIDEVLNERFKEENLYNGLARIELNSWKLVLFKLIDSHADGRVTKRYETQDALAAYAANEVRCQIPPKRILGFLSTRQILRREMESTLVQPSGRPTETSEAGAAEEEARDYEDGNKGSQFVVLYTLTHDAIGLALKEWKDAYDAIITTPGKYRLTYGVADRGDPIMLAADYAFDDLYQYPDQKKRPQPIVLNTVNDYLWDHQVLGFAGHKGFFKRLNFELVNSTTDPDRPSGQSTVESILGANAEPTTILSFPRNLVGEDMRQCSFDFAISNIFTGYSLITRPSVKRCFEPNEAVKSFPQVVNELSRMRIVAEDEAALGFVKGFYALTKLISRATRKHGSGINIPGQALNVADRSREQLFTMLDEEKIDVIVGTAPTRAYALQAGYPFYLDSTDLLYLVDSISRLNLDEHLRYDLLQVNQSLVVHNCWNLKVESAEWERDPELTRMLLRLASIALFTSSYVNKAQGEVIDYLQRENQWVIQKHMGKAVMQDTFSACYDFGLSDNYFNSYLDRCSRYFYNPEFSAGVSGGTSNPHKVYEKLVALRQRYYQLSEAIDVRIADSLWLNSVEVKSVRRLKEHARRHYNIYNYVDAVSALEQAGLLSGIPLN